MSPYRRTLHTLALLGSTRRGRCRSRGCASRTGATCRTPTGNAASAAERDFFGHFFYRLASGESGADVDDRLAAFLTELRLAPPDADALLVVTHGLAMRLLARRALGWSVPLFESLSNPEPCEERVLTLDGGRWHLDRPFAQWQTADDGTAQPGPTAAPHRVTSHPMTGCGVHHQRASRGRRRAGGRVSLRSNTSRAQASRLLSSGSASR